jgi:hypothetical protein
MGEMKPSYNIMVSSSKGRKTLGKPRFRWENSIKYNFKR